MLDRRGDRFAVGTWRAGWWQVDYLDDGTLVAAMKSRQLKIAHENVDTVVKTAPLTGLGAWRITNCRCQLWLKIGADCRKSGICGEETLKFAENIRWAWGKQEGSKMLTSIDLTIIAL